MLPQPIKKINMHKTDYTLVQVCTSIEINPTVYII